MPKKSSEPEGTYRYTGDQLGERADTALKTGTLVTVREQVSADTQGAHSATEDAVVIEWEAEAQVITDTSFRSESVPQVAMGDNGMPLYNTDGSPQLTLVQREVPVHTFGTGTVTRAMSVSVDRFTADFEEA